MKALKIVAIVVGVVAVLLALVFVLALTPTVQTWAVRKALAGQPGMITEVGRVAAGFSDARIDDLRVVKDGAVITAKSVTANYSAWDYISNQRVNVDQVTVRDLVVDLRNAKPAGAPASTTASQSPGSTQASTRTSTGSTKTGTAPGQAPVATKTSTSSFNGLLSQAQLPLDVRVAKLDVKGRALLPAEQTVDFDLQGANIATGQRGKVEWRADFADAKKTAPLRGLRSRGVASVHITSDRRIDLVELDASATADGPNLPKDQVKITAKAEQPTAGGNENYVVNVGLERGGRHERILGSTAQYQGAQRQFAGSWELAVRTEQLAAILAGFGLPEVAANGAGKFSFKPDTGAASASGDLDANVTALEKISPELKTIGAMQFKTSFDGGLDGNVARLEKFQLDANTREGKKLAQISLAQRVGFDLTTKHVAIANTKAELARIAVQSLPLAWAQPFVKGVTIDSGDLSITLAVEAEADGSRIRARSVEPLAIRNVTVRSGDKKLADQVTLTARPQVDYSATRIVADVTDLNISMPAGDSLAGKLGAEVTELAKTPRIAFTSQLQARVVAALKPYLPLDPGPLAIILAADGRLQGDVLHIAKANVTVNRESGALLTALELQQPVTANLARATATVPKPDATAARVRLGEIPLAWAEAFVANSKFAGAVTSATLEVSFRTADDATLTTTEPLMLRGVGATLEGKPMVQGLDVLTDLTATKRGDLITYELRKLEVKQGNAALLGLSTTGEARLKDKVTLVAKGKLDADVAALMNQPVAAQFATLSRGRLTAAFEANVGDAIQAKAAVSARNLVARQNNQALGDLEMTVTASIKPDGSGTIIAPLTLTNANRKSDVAIEAAFGKTADKKSFLFTGKISGNQLFVDDFQPLAALAPAGEKPKTPAAPRPTRDVQPFWAGAQGKVQLDLKRVVYGPTYVISPLRGTATITPSKIVLEGLEGRFNENPFKSSATIAFNAQQPKPYSLTGSADVMNFDVAAILRTANPNEKPAMESKVNLTARLNGSSGTIGDLATNVYGKFDVTGSGGVLRALGKKGEAVGAVSTIIGLIGAARGSNTTMAVAELAQAFNELRFDSFKMQVERAADLSLKVSTLEFISPIMRTTGTGGVANRGNQPMQNQPMEIILQFGAKAELAALLNKAGVLSGKQDEKGYYLMTQSFTVGGTPAKPDSSSLWQMIGAAAARAAAGAFLR
ncbi:MAG: hypothetical protein Q7S40_08440 [Opitutaceae bacterium]|nr:hypothetical protein [Opitutaceae bacterium]